MRRKIFKFEDMSVQDNDPIVNSPTSSIDPGIGKKTGENRLLEKTFCYRHHIAPIAAAVPILSENGSGKEGVPQVKVNNIKPLNSVICFLCFLVGFFGTGNGQALSGPETVKRYSAAQKRLLITSTMAFLSLPPVAEEDSVMLIAKDLYRLGFLTPYTEELQNTAIPAGTALVNTGRIGEAKQLLESLDGEKRIRLLLDLGTWYLHQPGTHKRDLDQANQYIQQAVHLTTATANKNLFYEARCLEGKWQFQIGQLAQCQTTFKNLIASSAQEKNARWQARCYQHLGELLPLTDSAKVVYLTKSRELYHNLGEKEREIEVLWQLTRSTYASSINTPAVQFLEEVPQLQQATGFQHSLYALSHLGLLRSRQKKLVEALQTAQAALANQQWSGVTALSSIFYRRIGNVHNQLGKKEEALLWLRKGLENRSRQTHLFWYSNLLQATSVLFHLNRYEEALKLMDTVVQEHPPITFNDKIMVANIRGDCYAGLNNTALADQYYMSFLNLYKANHLPETIKLYGPMCMEVANYYLKQGKVKKARLFLAYSNILSPFNFEGLSLKYSILYRMDSINGNYKSALQHYRQYRTYADSLTAMEQRSQFEELTVKYAAEKKDQNIKLLTERTKTQQATLKQKTLSQNLILGGSALLLVILALVFNQYRIKKRSSETVGKKNIQLQHLLTEKEWLVKEIHHRVKNNLQIVMSLLNSQKAFVDNPYALSAIHDSQHRVHAMSLIHQKLYRSENVTAIDMSIYIRELVSYLKECFPAGHHIQFDYNIEPIELDVGQAVPLGLILNEAITNSLKYAFPNHSNGKIEISLTQSDQRRCLLVISDNGIGIASARTTQKPGSLGMTLMQGLSEDLEGAFSIQNTNGTTIRIEFARELAVKRSGTSVPPFTTLEIR